MWTLSSKNSAVPSGTLLSPGSGETHLPFRAWDGQQDCPGGHAPLASCFRATWSSVARLATSSFSLEKSPSPKRKGKEGEEAHFPLFFNKMPLAACEAGLCQPQRLGAEQYFSHLGIVEKGSVDTLLSAASSAPALLGLLGPLSTPLQPFLQWRHPTSSHLAPVQPNPAQVGLLSLPWTA